MIFYPQALVLKCLTKQSRGWFLSCTFAIPFRSILWVRPVGIGNDRKDSKEKTREGVDEYGRTPLHHATEVSEIESLVASGQNINLQDDNGYSPLHFSAQRKNLNAILFLLENGDNPNALDVHGNSPLWTATMNVRGEFDCVVALLNAGANPDQKNKHGKSPADMANIIGNGLENIFCN